MNPTDTTATTAPQTTIPCGCHDAAHKAARMEWLKTIATVVLLFLLIILVLKSIIK